MAKTKSKPVERKVSRWLPQRVIVRDCLVGEVKFPCGSLRQIDFFVETGCLKVNVHHEGASLAAHRDRSGNRARRIAREVKLEERTPEYEGLNFGRMSEVLALAEMIADINGMQLVKKPTTAQTTKSKTKNNQPAAPAA